MLGEPGSPRDDDENKDKAEEVLKPSPTAVAA